MSSTLPTHETETFPGPVRPPEHVEDARASRQRDLLRVAWLGIALRLTIIGAELLAVWLLGYAALLVDAVASIFDVVSSLAIVLAIRLAARPPDEDHPFGHGRYEPLAGLQLGIVVALAGLWLATSHALGAIRAPAAGEVKAWAWMIPALAAVLLELIARLVRRVGHRERSTALTAEAKHYRVDAITSVVAAIGLLLASRYPEFGHRIDWLSAALLATIMIALGTMAARENLHQLLDGTPDDVHFDRVRASALKVTGVQDVEKVRIQQAGPDAHVDIDIEVEPAMSVADAHVITQHVRAQIQADWPFVREVVVHVEPFYHNDH
ncbi:putative cation efflux system protein [Maioricimonas rarisocia]|uniref:Putative cation efflux system protein n=1 Tax=Maioricimonas rarisocia TaxID=2528026 RepID=A0A517Z7F0_9PLAN|nr:cation diffusion facilitator family transporter [Maioricimonas rarisocia]QDU38374.1 putative cation efflux system protein [Maioricimonas rarisocia]